MELLGGLLVLLAMAWCGAAVCAGGLCSNKQDTPTEGQLGTRP